MEKVENITVEFDTGSGYLFSVALFLLWEWISLQKAIRQCSFAVFSFRFFKDN